MPAPDWLVSAQVPTAAAFYGRFKRYLRSKYGLSSQQAKDWLHSIRRNDADRDDLDDQVRGYFFN